MMKVFSRKGLNAHYFTTTIINSLYPQACMFPAGFKGCALTPIPLICDFHEQNLEGTRGGLGWGGECQGAQEIASLLFAGDVVLLASIDPWPPAHWDERSTPKSDTMNTLLENTGKLWTANSGLQVACCPKSSNISGVFNRVWDHEINSGQNEVTLAEWLGSLALEKRVRSSDIWRNLE